MPSRYDQNTKAKAVRLVRDHVEDYESEWAAITTVAGRLGMSAETLRKWVRQAEIDAGEAPGVECDGGRGAGVATEERRAGAHDRDLEGGHGFLRAGVRPATALTCAFVACHKERFGVAPICRALSELGAPIAPRTFGAWASRAPSKRAWWDAAVTEILAGIYEPDEQGRRPPESLYGSVKMWAHLQRQGIPVARCTIERLMRAHGWRGVTRARRVRTTIADPAATRAPDLVNRQFHTNRPDVLWVADFTYVPMTCGFGYTAFVIDAFAGLVAGWECSTSKQTAFVERAIRGAVDRRRREGHPLAGGTIHHGDAGSQYTAVHFGDTLVLEGLVGSIGTVGDAYDNALAQTTIGLYKTECIRDGSPFRTGPIRTLADLEEVTSAQGALVQHQQAHAPARTAPTRRSRSPVLRSRP